LLTSEQVAQLGLEVAFTHTVSTQTSFPGAEKLCRATNHAICILKKKLDRGSLAVGVEQPIFGRFSLTDAIRVRTLLVPCFREIIWMSDTSLK
jgi:hypothetical protein